VNLINLVLNYFKKKKIKIIYIMENFAFYDILKKQLDNKKKYINYIKPSHMGCTIVVESNKVKEVINGTGWIEEARKQQFLKIINDCLSKYNVKNVILNINLPDHPLPGYLNFCRTKNNNNCFLMPNSRFALDDVLKNDNEIFENYDFQKNFIKSNIIKKEEKINKIYTSCIPHISKIEYFRYAKNNTDICDGYCNIGTCHGLVALNINECNVLQKLNMAGKENISWMEHLKYKYVLYNDGNTLSDRMRLLLCTESVILYKTSIYEEFYSYKLENSQNYIEYQDVNEIRNIINTIENNDEHYNIIVKNNNNFINNILTYENVLLYCYYLFNGLAN